MCAGKASASTSKRTTKERKAVEGEEEEEGPGDDEEGEEFDWPPLVCCFGEAHYEFVPTVRPFDRQMDEDIYSSWKGLQWSPPEFARAPGTSPSNVAVALARLGGRVVFVGKVANDVFGNELLTTLNSNGVQTRGVKLADCYGTAVSQMKLTCGTGSGVQMTCESPSVESTLQSEDVDLDILKEVHQRFIRFNFIRITFEGPIFHGFEMTNLIDHIVKITDSYGAKLISAGSMKNFSYVGQKRNKIEQRKSSYDPLKSAKIHEAQLVLQEFRSC